MKKALVASLLGIALNVASSYGQGYIIMQNYDLVNGTTPVFAGVTYGSGAKAGEYVGAASGFAADLLYSLNGGNTFTLAAGSQTPFYTGSAGPSADGGSPTTDGAGTFFGPTVTIPGYTSGSVIFEVQAFNGTYTGTSAPFTITSLNNNPNLPSDDLLQLNGGTTSTGLQAFSVNAVPEPTVFALAGLGAAALMAIRRKK
jgi:hypothetical protein